MPEGEKRGFEDCPYAHRCRCWIWLLCSIFFAIIAVVSTLFALYFKTSGGDDLMYGPTDTRIINVSSIFCNKIQLGVGESVPGYQVYLYTLNYPPTVIKHSNFLLNERPFGDYQYYSYYMLSGSTFNVSACLLDHNLPRVDFYVSKGNKDYANHEYHITVSSLCQTSNTFYSYSVIQDDFYYLVFDAERPIYNYALNVTMYFDLIHYEVYNHTVIEECHLDTSDKECGSCSLGIPLSGDVTSLLQVMPAKNNTKIDWQYSTYVNVRCSARVWIYAVIACCMLIGIVGPFTFACILCKFKKRAKSGSADRTEQTIAPLLPPSNAYDYGSNYSAPPPYHS